MDVIGFCVSDSYQIKPLAEYLRNQYKINQFRDVIVVELEKSGDIFIFSYGVIVSWGLSRDRALQFIEEIKPYENNRCSTIETDEFTYIIGEKPAIIEDEIILPSFDVLSKLAISHGIAQSVELNLFESTIQHIVDNTKVIPRELVEKGRISLSRKEIRQKMGELFVERSTINLHVDALDLPEFFWDYPELEPLYQMVANYLDIRARVEVLNHRLDILHELYEVLANELNHQHSSRLEWTIILLIVIEVVLTLLRDVFQIL
ncbi:MAG: RMD1 family protein [Parachlamydiaceae bacterium]